MDSRVGMAMSVLVGGALDGFLRGAWEVGPFGPRETLSSMMSPV